MSGASDVKRVLAPVGDLMPPATAKTRSRAEGGSKKGHFYKPLPKFFRRNGLRYRQIVRERDAAIYEQTWTGCAEPSPAYEVIRVRCRDEFRIRGRLVEPAEVYPTSDAWGTDGFTFTDGDKALARFLEISLEEPARRGRR